MRVLKLVWCACLLVTMSISAHSQSIIDDSGARLAPGDVKLISELVGALLNDPHSAQLRDIQDKGNRRFCGRFNAKNAFGGYVGFRLFAADLKSRLVYIERPVPRNPSSREELERVRDDLGMVITICTGKPPA
ncbi:MAG: hypothetical protein ACRECO_01865 [Xanthobacteraceae bacterium]